MSLLEEFRTSKQHIRQMVPRGKEQWKPSTDNMYKSNVDVAIFHQIGLSGVGAIIRNSMGLPMVML